MRRAKHYDLAATLCLGLTVISGAETYQPGTSWWGPLVFAVASFWTVNFTVSAAAVRTLAALKSAADRLRSEEPRA